MNIRLFNQRGIWVDVVANVTWTASFSRREGACDFWVYRDSPAWSPDFVSREGGYVVEITHELGRWVGISKQPLYTPQGARIRAVHVSRWLQLRTVSPNRVMYQMSPGVIVRRGFRDALGGSHLPLTFGNAVEGGRTVEAYQFRGQQFGDLLSDMETISGHEWYIDDELRFWWTPTVGIYHDEFSFVDDGAIFGEFESQDLDDVRMEITEVSEDGNTFTASAYEHPMWWPSQRTERI